MASTDIDMVFRSVVSIFALHVFAVYWSLGIPGPVLSLLHEYIFFLHSFNVIRISMIVDIYK